MTILLTIIHVFVCLVLILVVLLQSGKSADLAGAFGGAGSQTAFGARGTATFLSKLTTGAAVVFMITSLTLSIYRSKGTGSSIMEKAKVPASKPAAETQTKPAAPMPGPLQPSSPPPSPSHPAGSGGAQPQPK
ncbi:MAG TPA: preprotein translocase subunit SecG [Terriglobia bacterium]|nr:preprotein translocase subunit SecG [Terriglobia bacterium]